MYDIGDNLARGCRDAPAGDATMNILSIQSAVVYGHVGNAAAVLPLQRLGHDVWPLHTVQFSNHTGYDSWRGRVFPADELASLLEGLAARGAFARCDAVLSGYLGEAATGRVVLEAVARGRAAHAPFVYCCDPVMGDAGKGLFVGPDIPRFFAEEAIPAADLVTPNQFELQALTGRSAVSLAEIVAAAHCLRAQGPAAVAVTSLLPPAVAPGRIGSLLATAEGSWLVDNPLLEFVRPPAGCGDVFAATLLGRLLSSEPPPSALEKTVNGLHALLERTLAADSQELALVAAQGELVNPPLFYPAARID